MRCQSPLRCSSTGRAPSQWPRRPARCSHGAGPRACHRVPPRRAKVAPPVPAAQREGARACAEETPRRDRRAPPVRLVQSEAGERRGLRRLPPPRASRGPPIWPSSYARRRTGRAVSPRATNTTTRAQPQTLVGRRLRLGRLPVASKHARSAAPRGAHPCPPCAAAAACARGAPPRLARQRARAQKKAARASLAFEARAPLRPNSAALGQIKRGSPTSAMQFASWRMIHAISPDKTPQVCAKRLESAVLGE